MKNRILDKIDWDLWKLPVFFIIACVFIVFYEKSYTDDYPPREAELTQMYAELKHLPGTTFWKKSVGGKEGNVYIDYYFSSELSKEEVLTHYERELTNKEWEFRGLSTEREPHKGEWVIINKARYVREKNVRENGHYEAIIQYMEYPGYQDTFFLFFKFKKYVVPWLR